MMEKREDEVRQILDNTSQSDLIDFVTKIALEDGSFYQQIRRQFGNLSDDEKLAETKGDISGIIATNTYRGFIDYNACIEICEELDKITREALNSQQTGHFNLAIQEVLLVIRGVVGILEKADDSSGATTETMDYAYDALKQLSQQATDKLTDKQKKALVQSAVRLFNLKRFDGWLDLRYTVLENMIPLLTFNSFKLVEKAMDKLLERQRNSENPDNVIYGSNTNFDYKQYRLDQTEELNAKLKAQILIGLGNFDDAKRVMAENIAFNAVRQVAVEFYMSQNDFKTAEELAVAGLSSKKTLNPSKKWLDDLEKIYQKTNAYQKLAKVYKDRLMLGGWLIDLKDYQKLKAVVQQHGNWHDTYPKLLQEFSQRLQPNSYAMILNFENETVKLMEVVERNPTFVFEYGGTLYSQYPDKVTSLYYDSQVRDRMGNTRKQYRKLGQTILRYAGYGNKKISQKWCQQLIDQYSNRPALVDEMQKASAQI